MNSKNEIRRELLKRRNDLPSEERRKASLAVCQRIMEDDRFLDARGIHVYIPVGSEVDVRPLVDVAWELGKGVGMMLVHEDGGTSQCRITPSTEFNVGGMGIPQPLNAEVFNMDLCDLVIVPVVAADENCNRLGYGKGYYDQFLTHYPRPSIGAAYDAQVIGHIPIDELDIRLDNVYTESRVIGAIHRDDQTARVR